MKMVLLFIFLIIAFFAKQVYAEPVNPYTNMEGNTADIFPYMINWYDGTEWKEINRTFKLFGDCDNDYCVAGQGVYEAGVNILNDADGAVSIRNNGVWIAYNTSRISMSRNGEETIIRQSQSRIAAQRDNIIEYNQPFGTNTKLQYVYEGEFFKEIIQIDNPIIIDTTGEMQVVSNFRTNGRITIENGILNIGDEIFLMPPVIYDSEDNYIFGKYQVLNNNKIIVSFNATFLNEAVYPIYIDPTTWITSYYHDGYVDHDRTLGTYARTTDPAANIFVGAFEMTVSTDGHDHNSRGWINYNTASINDRADILNVTMNYTIFNNGDHMDTLKLIAMEKNESSYTDNATGNPLFFNDMGNGSIYFSTGTTSIGNYTADLGASGVADLESLLSQDWFAVGMISHEISGLDPCNGCNPLRIRSRSFSNPTVRPSLRIIFADYGANVTLQFPANGATRTNPATSFRFNATDDFGLVNASLWHNVTGTFQRNNTVPITNLFNQSTINITLPQVTAIIWNVEVCDNNNNCTFAPNNFSLTLKRPADYSPNVTLKNPANNQIYTNQSTSFGINLVFNTTDDWGLSNATLYHNASGVFNANQTLITSNKFNESSFNMSFPNPTGITWNVLVCDDNKNCSFASSNFSFQIKRIDYSSNVTLILPLNGNITDNQRVNYTFNATDDFGLVNATLYHNASGVWLPNFTIPITNKFNFTNFTLLMPFSNFSWNVLVCDDNKNCSYAASNFTLSVINTTRPNDLFPTVTLIHPPDNNITDNQLINYTFKATDDNNLVNATLYNNLTGSWLPNLTILLGGISNQTNFTILTPFANFSWNVLVCDNGANCTYAPNNFTLSILNTTRSIENNPVVSLISPPDNNITDNSLISFVFNATDEVGLNNATLYHNASGSWLPNTTIIILNKFNQSSFNITMPQPSNFTWNVLVCDDNKNCSYAPQNRSMEIVPIAVTPTDYAPSVSLIAPINNTFATNLNISFAFNATDDIGLVNATLYHTIMNGTLLPNQTISLTNKFNQSSFNMTVPVNLTFQWNVYVCDTNMNCSFAPDNWVVNTRFSLWELAVIVGMLGSAVFLTRTSGSINDQHKEVAHFLRLLSILMIAPSLYVMVIIAGLHNAVIRAIGNEAYIASIVLVATIALFSIAYLIINILGGKHRGEEDQ